jgi:hypothetical protein
MEAERPCQPINFYTKHGFRTDKTVLFIVTAVKHPSSHKKGLSILYNAIYKSFIKTMKGDIKARVKGIKHKINKVKNN